MQKPSGSRNSAWNGSSKAADSDYRSLFTPTLGLADLPLDKVLAEYTKAYSLLFTPIETIGTKITAEMLEAYTSLHEQAYAHSVESWQEGELVGGVYGVALGRAFFAESMFTRVPDASKVALVSLVRQLQAWEFRIIDCQQASPHVMRFGAEEIPRRDFLIILPPHLR